MKFQHLPVGARFEYEGRTYVKTGPLSATSEQGGQRMIPRYAVLKPLDEPAAPANTRPARKLDEARVLAAFETFCGECAALLGEPSKPDLEAARLRFIAALK